MEVSRIDTQPLQYATPSHAQTATQNRAVEKTQTQADVAKEQLSEKSFSEKVEEATKKLNEQMQELGTSIRFGYNDKLELMYVNVMELKTGDVIRKIPTEQVMKLSETFKEAIGLLFDKES
ncbi:MAG: FlaG family protein [Campylobacter sp.]